MAQTLTLARPARNLRPYLWLALPLLVLATLFFYPLLLIAEQALRDASGNLSLETFWQVIDSNALLARCSIPYRLRCSLPLAAWYSAACWR